MSYELRVHGKYIHDAHKLYGITFYFRMPKVKKLPEKEKSGEVKGNK